MRFVKLNLVKYLAMIGMGGTLAATVAGCATTAEGPATAAMTPRVAEQICVGVPAKERQLGLLAYRDAIGGSRTLKETEQVGKAKLIHDRGVAIEVRAQPGMSAPWLERVASCHIALAASGQGTVAMNTSDPLLVPGTSVRVEEAGMSYVVSIRVGDGNAATEVSRRARALVAAGAPATTTQAISLR